MPKKTDDKPIKFQAGKHYFELSDKFAKELGFSDKFLISKGMKKVGGWWGRVRKIKG